MSWASFAAGLFVGAPVGLLAMALCVAASNADRATEGTVAVADDDGDDLAAWGGCYPRVEHTQAAHDAASPTTRR